MLYLLAILLPPLAILFCGKPFQAVLNIPLSLLLWIPGMVHALFVVHAHYADQRHQELLRTLEGRPPQKPQSFRLS